MKGAGDELVGLILQKVDNSFSFGSDKFHKQEEIA